MKQALGNDGNIYWITTNRNRVPVEGTSAPEWKGGGPIISEPERIDLKPVISQVDLLLATLVHLQGD